MWNVKSVIHPGYYWRTGVAPITMSAHYRLTFSANGLVALPASVDRLFLLTMHANGTGHSSVQNFLRGSSGRRNPRASLRRSWRDNS